MPNKKNLKSAPKTQAKPKTQPKSRAKPTPKRETKLKSEAKHTPKAKPTQKAQQKAKPKRETWHKDEYAKYQQYQPEVMDEEMFEEIAKDKRNTWAKGIGNKQFKYNSKLLDPQYAAQKAVKNGHKAYVGDVNKDGVDDVMIINKSGKIKAFNAHIPKKSKQQQYMEYYKAGGVKNENGKAVFGDKKDFKAWIAMTVANMDANGTRAKINKELNKQGFASYKVKQKTFMETIKSQAKTFYETAINEFSNMIKLPVSEINKVMNYNKFISIYLRTILNSLFNINPATPSDSNEAKIINKVLKRKWSEESGLTNLQTTLNTAIGDITTKNDRLCLKGSIGLMYEGLLNGMPIEEMQHRISENIYKIFGPDYFNPIVNMCTHAANIVFSEMNQQ